MNMPSPQSPNFEPFFIVDFDRTLADSDKLLDVFIEVSQQHIDIPREQIDAAYADVVARGDSFDTASYVRDHLAENDETESWDQLEKQFIHESRALNMLLPGAAELLAYLESTNKRFGILTYGNPLWQHLKLTAAGFNHVPRMVLTQKHKGRLVNSWRQDDGTFRLPEEFNHHVTDRVIMIDDKAVSFAEFPDVPSQGYWVLDPSRELPSQQGEVPGNVKRVSQMSDALKFIANL